MIRNLFFLFYSINNEVLVFKYGNAASKIDSLSESSKNKNKKIKIVPSFPRLQGNYNLIAGHI